MLKALSEAERARRILRRAETLAIRQWRIVAKAHISQAVIRS
jgi:hypothetical protein